MAPEIFNLKTDNTNKVDSWALGVLIYIMVTGVPPFTGEEYTFTQTESMPEIENDFVKPYDKDIM